MSLLLAVSYNQPRFYDNTSWNPYAITVLNHSSYIPFPFYVFVNTKNTAYIGDNTVGHVQAWAEGSTTPTRSFTDSFAPFATSNEDVFVCNADNRIDWWAVNATSSVALMFIGDKCQSLFIDMNNTLYCSASSVNMVVSKSLDNTTNSFTAVAGTGYAGSALDNLASPFGILVDSNFNLFVADTGNNRVQRFQPGQSSGTTIAGNGTMGTIDLFHPTDVVLDGNGYFFILDSGNNRIVRSRPSGFQCVVGCTNGFGSAANQLSSPQTMSFDTYGNLWVADVNNNRVQKFTLSNGFLGKRYPHLPLHC